MTTNPPEQDADARHEPAGQSTSDAPAPPARPADAPLTHEPAKPRIWPSLTIVPLAIVAILAAQVVLGIAFALTFMFEGATPGEIVQMMVGDARFIIVSIFVNQTILMIAAVTAASLSGERFASRLGLAWPTVPLWSLPLMMVGTAFIWGMVMLAFPHVFPEPSDHLIAVSEMLFELARTNPLLLITMIAILPPVFEELLVRGYVLRRTTARWGPFVGISLSTVLFALLHIDPQHALGVIPVGVWCGFVAWRTGSVLPAMLCHAANNGCAVGVLLLNANLVTAGESPDEAIEAIVADAGDLVPWPFLLVTGAALALSIVVLIWWAKPTWRHHASAEAM